MRAGRALVGGVVAAAAWLCWRTGGAGEAPAPKPGSVVAEPHAAASAGAKPAGPDRTGPGGAYEVHTRLLEALPAAKYESPGFKVGLGLLGDHWRRMSVPWTALSGDDVKRTSSIALRTSASEKQWSMPKANGDAWEPDARVWNMNEGSWDQRESILAPSPTTITYRLELPAHPALALSTATAAGASVTFKVTLVDASGAPHVLHTGTPGKTWADARLDLEAWGGQAVTLELATSTASGVGVGVWGNPAILAKGTPRVPYNVLFVVVDALRPDVVASFHDDAEDATKMRAHLPPLEALLPRVPGLMPAMDELAKRGARFTHAWSGGAWTRPGTLSMLAGARASELGVDTMAWMLPEAASSSYYASDPPLLPLALRRRGVATRAFVNNYFMVGYAPVGLDMGFERVDDHRYRTRDTMEITRDAVAWLRQNKDQRFFVFCNYNSPHEPWEPPPELEKRVPPHPRAPADYVTRRYMAEAAKDDEAIGVLMKALDDLGLRDRTLVVVTADHGETLSSAHAGTALLDKMAVRYHHAVSNYEETTRIPILIAGPGLPADVEVKARVRNTDLAPTLLELLGAEASPKMSGRSLVPLLRGEKEAEVRVVVSEGRGTRAILWDKWRLLLREGPARTTTTFDKDGKPKTVTVAEELFDLADDPGERNNLAAKRPEIVAELRARLDAAQRRVAVTGSTPAAAAVATGEGGEPWVRLRFAGAGASRRVQGTIEVTGARIAAALPVGIGAEALRVDGPRIEVALRTATDAVVGLDVRTSAPSVTWRLTLDDQPWPKEAAFGGRWGIASPSLAGGVATDEARAAAAGTELPYVDAARDLGLFVVRDRVAESRPPERVWSGEGAREVNRLLREWGYARGK